MEEHVRLVVLGGAGVGKSCIVRRFLDGTYCDRYRSTVEDLYTREFRIGGGSNALRLDVLDTAGDQQFPAMRRLSIATAHAFLLVYAATSAPSFHALQRCLQELQEQRPDYQDVPIVVAGNKLDLARSHREVAIEDVSEWVYCELPRLRSVPSSLSASSSPPLQSPSNTTCIIKKSPFHPSTSFSTSCPNIFNQKYPLYKYSFSS